MSGQETGDRRQEGNLSCLLSPVSCLLLVAGVALAVRLAFGFRAPPFVTNDSLSYLLPGFDLARGLDFAPILKRPPFYPLFVGGVVALFGEELRALTLVQHGLGVLTALCAFGIGRLIFGPLAGLLAGLMTALSGPLIVTEHYLMSEILFGTLLSGALLAFLVGVRRGSLEDVSPSGPLAPEPGRPRGAAPTGDVGHQFGPAWFALAGGLLGLAALTRPIAQLVLVLLLLALPLLLPRWRGAVVPGVVLVGCFALAVLPWMARNLAVQGTFAVAGGLGEGLAVRTIRYDQQFDFRDPPGDEADRLLGRARRIYRDEAADGSAFALARRLRDELGVTELQADHLMRRIALDAIQARPGYYLQGTIEMFGRTLVGRPVRLRQDWTPWRNIVWEPRVAHLLPAPTPAEERQFPVAEGLASLYDPARPPYPLVIPFLLAIGAFSGLTRRHRPALLLATLVLGLLLAGAALIGVEWRYRYPLDPFINVLAAGGLVQLATGLLYAARRARPRPQPGLGQVA